MGNQREIRQAESRYCRGVVLRVKPESAQFVRELVESLDHQFYSSFVPAGGAVDFPNLDGPDTSLRHLEGDHVIIQSGGKMWCGYEAFIDHVRILAPHLEDGLFYVGDEEDYIDEYHTLMLLGFGVVPPPCRFGQNSGDIVVGVANHFHERSEPIGRVKRKLRPRCYPPVPGKTIAIWIVERASCTGGRIRIDFAARLHENALRSCTKLASRMPCR